MVDRLSDKRDRLKAALRANLHKRKEQQRERLQDTDSAEAGDREPDAKPE